MRAFLLSMLSLALPVSGQLKPTEPEPSAADVAARQRLTKALLQTADQAGTGFQANWGPGGNKAQGANRLQAFLSNHATGEVTGEWFPDHRQLRFTGDEKDQVICRGSQMIARDDKRGWRRRRGHFADGNKLSYVPDPQLLLRQLGEWPLAVTRRDVGSLDDRPVEVLSVTLNAEQVGELIWSGAVPPNLSHGGAAVFNVAARLGGGRRVASTPPSTTVDLAIVLDPATNIVHELRVRAWAKQGRGVGNVVVFNARQVQIGGAEQEDEEEEQDEEATDGPMQYVDGLPKRPRKGMAIMDFKLRLRDHGRLPAAALTDEQRRLLR